MPFCCKTTTTWAQNLRVGQDYRQYTVQLVRQIGYCCETYRIFVNNQEIEHHQLTYNPCSPLCCPGGLFEFEQDGHTFLVMYNTLSWTTAFGGFRLFIDGVDVNTGREFSAFWRRRGWQVIVLGLVFLIVGILLSPILYYALHVRIARAFRVVTYALTLTGVVYIIIGLIPILRYRRPRYSGSATVEFTPQAI